MPWNKKYAGITRIDIEDALKSGNVGLFDSKSKKERYYIEYNGAKYRLKETCRRAMWLHLGRDPNASDATISHSWEQWCNAHNHDKGNPTSGDFIKLVESLGIKVGDRKFPQKTQFDKGNIESPSKEEKKSESLFNRIKKFL